MKPSETEVGAYGKTLSPPFTEAGEFIDHYTANGWKVGRNPMKGWKATVRSWNHRRNGKKKARRSGHDEEIEHI